MPRQSFRKSLRSIMYGRIVLWVFVCGIIASACVYATAELLFARINGEARDFSIREAEDRLKLFDLILSKAEEESFEQGRRALLELNRLYPTSGSLASLGSEGMESEAERLGVSEIYLIGGDGKIAASSLRSDIGLDLPKLSKAFAAMLAGLYGTGRTTDQRLSQSTLTGVINAYQYYSPKGSRYIIEVSTRLDEAIKRSFPGMDYENLVELAFGGLDRKDAPPLARIVDLVSVQGVSVWSLFQNRASDSAYAHLIAEARKRGDSAAATARDAGSVVMIKRLTQGRTAADPVAGKYYAIFELDLHPLIRFRLIAFAGALGACCLAVGLSLVALKRSFERGVASRIERLRLGIARAADGDYVDQFEGYGEDEIGAIASGVGTMVKNLLEKERRLSAAARMETIGAMAGGLAHDFGNVLTGIKGTIDCIEMSVEKGIKRDELLELTGLASRTATRGENLVRSLFDLAEPRSAEGDSVDLSAIAREAAELSRGKMGGEVAIKVETPPEPLIVRGEGQAVLRAVLNLCVNGIQAMTSMRGEGEARGGTLLVSAEARPGSGGSPDEAAILVKDEGVGIAPEDKGRILAPFYSTKPRGLGSGIGLAIVLSVVERHGGRLEIDSEPGKGSTFALILPA